ncbi:ACH96133.1 GrBNV gp13-like protein [Kallithea virus]|uniref:ACH96133.1 GrBNV gp13-like protein n=1 Tax=Kallithea virus TaxID=1654582 RepID=A0A1S5VFY8_9VIRU|nr:ACH96133.1 GrBNV gp13-like protein [Kallithea virus]AQN78563.1 ACH96133.1 GrBNV gp13-like protein [Kallithea virus]
MSESRKRSLVEQTLYSSNKRPYRQDNAILAHEESNRVPNLRYIDSTNVTRTKFNKKQRNDNIDDRKVTASPYYEINNEDEEDYNTDDSDDDDADSDLQFVDSLNEGTKISQMRNKFKSYGSNDDYERMNIESKRKYGTNNKSTNDIEKSKAYNNIYKHGNKGNNIDNGDDKGENVVISNGADDDYSGGVIKLPGGSGIPSAIKNLGSGIGEIPKESVKLIRDYMDMLFSSVAIEANYLLQMNQQESILAIPGIVNAILEYNNLSFTNIKYCKTKIELIEPVWYTFNIAKSELILYFNEAFYDQFCMKNNDKPVLFTSGIIPIELLNPYETNPLFQTIDSAMIHSAILADHVAQHIILDIYRPDRSQCASIHDKFSCIGTTLHSIFFIEQNSLPMPKREYNNYMTMVPNNGNNLGFNGNVMNSTRNLLNNFLHPTSGSALLGTNTITGKIQDDIANINSNASIMGQQSYDIPSFRYTV